MLFYQILKPSDVKIGIEVENIIYNDKNQRIKVNPSNSFSATDLIGNLRNKKSYSLEPGGQVEWNSRLYTNLHDLEKSLRLNLESLKKTINKQNLKIMPFDYPYFSPDKIELIDQNKYKIMDKNMIEAGSMGQWMMRCTLVYKLILMPQLKKKWRKQCFLLIAYIQLQHIYFQIAL